MRMEQIRPKALICFETKTTLHHITSNNSMALNHRELSPRDLIQTSHKLSFFIYVKGGRGHLESATAPSPTKAPAAKRQGKTPHSYFPYRWGQSKGLLGFPGWGDKNKVWLWRCIEEQRSCFHNPPAGSSPIYFQTWRISSSRYLDASSASGSQGPRILWRLAGDEGTAYVTRLAVCWGFNAHSGRDKGGESLQAQSKTRGQLPL